LRNNGGREVANLEPSNAQELLETLEEWEAQLSVQPDLKEELQAPNRNISLPKLRGPKP